MTDLVLPSAVPIETYVDEAMAVLAGLHEDAPENALAGFDFDAQGVWSLARPGAPPIKLTESLADAGVVDGALLIVVPVSRTERYRPLVEDVIDAIAVFDEAPEFDRPALYRFIGVAIPMTAAIITAVATYSWAATGHDWWWSVALGGFGVCLMGGSIFAQRHHGPLSSQPDSQPDSPLDNHLDFAESLLASSLLMLGVAAALAVPLPRGVESIGAPQIAGAGCAVLLFVLATRGGPRRRAGIAAFLAVAATALIAAAVAFGYGWDSWVPTGLIVFGLIVVTNAAKLTVAVARITLPPIPAPGETIANDELLDPVAGPDPTEDSETWRAIIAAVPDSAARLSERSQLARRLLIGFLAAGSLVLSVGSIALVSQGHFFIHSVIVSGLIAVVCGFRSRLYAERWCAWALLAAAVTIPTGIMVRLCFWYPAWAWLILALYTTLALIAVISIGATNGIQRISPVTKRVLELIDGAAIAAVIPMLLWIAGVYDLLRNLRL